MTPSESERSTDVTRLIILANKPDDLEDSVEFLKKRGFEVYVTNEVRIVIQLVASRKVHWVLISVNHPTAHLEKMPLLMSHSFGVQTVAFAEIPDPASLTKLNTFKCPVIRGRLTGPNISLNLGRLDRLLKAAGENGSLSSVSVQTAAAGPVMPSTSAQTPAAAKPKQVASTSSYERASDLHPNIRALSHCVVMALQDICRPEGEIKNHVKGTDSLGVILLKHPEFEGSLVITCAGQNSPLLSSTLFLQQRINYHLKVRGQKWENQYTGVLPLPLEDVKSWSTARVEFMHGRQNGSGEILVSYLNFDVNIPELQPFKGRGKLELAVGDLPAGTRLPCDVYIHLPQNDRFVKFQKQDGIMSEQQKQRLQEMQTPALLINMEDAQKMSLFFITTRIVNAPARRKPKAA